MWFCTTDLLDSNQAVTLQLRKTRVRDECANHEELLQIGVVHLRDRLTGDALVVHGLFFASHW